MTSGRLLYGDIFSGLEAFSILRNAFLTKIKHRDIGFLETFGARQLLDLLMSVEVINLTESEYDP